MAFRIVLVAFFTLQAALISYTVETTKDYQNPRLSFTGIGPARIVSIDGEWNFAWNRLVTPEEIPELKDSDVARVGVPGRWNEYTIRGGKLPADGYATYWIDLEFPENAIGAEYALYIPEIPTAYVLWIGTDRIASNGNVGTDAGTSLPRSFPRIAFFNVAKKVERLVVQVSNFHDYNAGLWKSISLGTRERILAKKTTGLAYDLIFFGALFAIGVYHIILYVLRRKEAAIAFFAIVCLSIAGRSLITGEFFLFCLFPDFPWQLYIQLNFFLVYTAILSFSLFIAFTYERYFHKTVKYAVLIMSAIFFVLLLVNPGKVYLYSWEAYQFLLIAVLCYIFFIIGRAILSGAEGAYINVVAFAITFACALNDILYGKALIQTLNLAPVGIFSFTISQSAILAIKYSTTFRKMEEVSKRLKRASIAVKKKNRLIQQANTELQELYTELDTSQKEITYRLSQIAETRSRETGNHVKRVAAYVIFLAREYGLSPEESELLGNAAPMHDVGKMAIPDEILNKQGKLTPGEFETMKAHTTIGYAILRNSGRKILNAASIIALEHHERYNGTGYPDAISGDTIHVYGRIVAIADVFDALASDRCYKKAWPMDRILEYFRTESGGHFDPRLTDIFLNNIPAFEHILGKYEDTFNL